MPGQQDKKDPRKRYPSDYRQKQQKSPPAILRYMGVVEKEAWQHVYLYRVDDTVRSPYSNAEQARLRQFGEKLLGSEPGWCLVIGNNAKVPELDEIEVFSVISPSQAHAEVKFQQYVRGNEIEQASDGGIRKLPPNVLWHKSRPLGLWRFSVVYAEYPEQDGRKKTGMTSSGECSPQHAAALGHPGLQRYVHNQAKKQANTSGLSPMDLEGEAWLRLSMAATDDLERLKEEARRAIWAAIKRESGRRNKVRERLKTFQRDYCQRIGRYEGLPFEELLMPPRKKS